MLAPHSSNNTPTPQQSPPPTHTHRQAIEFNLYEEAFEIYKKFGKKVNAIQVLLVHLNDLDRAHEYANKVRRVCGCVCEREAVCVGAPRWLRWGVQQQRRGQLKVWPCAWVLCAVAVCCVVCQHWAHLVPRQKLLRRATHSSYVHPTLV